MPLFIPRPLTHLHPPNLSPLYPHTLLSSLLPPAPLLTPPSALLFYPLLAPPSALLSFPLLTFSHLPLPSSPTHSPSLLSYPLLTPRPSSHTPYSLTPSFRSQRCCLPRSRGTRAPSPTCLPRTRLLLSLTALRSNTTR
jgi:hypothetical protein